MAFANGSFFLGNTDAVLKFPYARSTANYLTGQKIADLPGGGYNWTRNVVVSPDGQKVVRLIWFTIKRG